MSLPAREIVAVWEAGASQHPVDRALTMLRLASPLEPPAALARLSIGERDRRLLTLREELYGSGVEAVTQCPSCNHRVELAFSIDDIRLPDTNSPDATAPEGALRRMNHDGWTVDFRLPDSLDLAAIALTPDRERALEVLAGRCLLAVRRDGELHPAAELPGETVLAWRSQLGELDPQAETRLRLSCPACAHQWSELFDIASFLWTELSADARRLLGEVDTIARVYGWGEEEILSLTRARRETYLEMIGA